MTRYPREHSSPGVRVGTQAPVVGSTILTSTLGSTVPTVEVRVSRSSVRRVMVEAGDVSVIP